MEVENLLNMDIVPGVLQLSNANPRLARKGDTVLCKKAIPTAGASMLIEVSERID
jgi:hypothetical protein